MSKDAPEPGDVDESLDETLPRSPRAPVNELGDTADRHLGELIGRIRSATEEDDDSYDPLGTTRPVEGRSVTSLSRLRAPEPGAVIRDTWELLDLVGQGGFGLVFIARHRNLGRNDALKFLHPHLANDAEVRARFEREAMVMARMRGDHLVHVHDYGEHEGLPFFAMEHLEGQSLEQRLEATEPLPMPEFYRLADGILRGLAEIHAYGVVHRDVKPANIFALERTGRIKMLDFGLAMTSMRVTSKGSMMGTPLYMAPELLLSPDVEASVATDVYSAGVVLYEMLTGRVPFLPSRNGKLADFLQQVITATPRPPSVGRPEIPDAVEDLVLRAIDKDPDQRPETADEMVEALVHARANAPAVPVRRAVLDTGMERAAEVETKAGAEAPPSRRWGPRLAAVAAGIGIVAVAVWVGTRIGGTSEEPEPVADQRIGEQSPEDHGGVAPAPDEPAPTKAEPAAEEGEVPVALPAGSTSGGPEGVEESTGSATSTTSSDEPPPRETKRRPRTTKPKTDAAVVAGLRKRAASRCRADGTTTLRVEGIISSEGRAINLIIGPEHASAGCVRAIVKGARFSAGQQMRPMPKFEVKL